ncbi:MAG: hypothetical protein ACLF0P_08220, partial [Thermoanaerobaculia bacterium]
MPTRAHQVFTACVEAIESGVLIERESRKDKEFHFQDWFKDRLEETYLSGLLPRMSEFCGHVQAA